MVEPAGLEDRPGRVWPHVLVLVIASLIVGALTHNRAWSLGDDGNLLMAAKRTADGEVPFVDFVHYFYSPGRIYLVAALFKVTGVSYLALRWLWVVVRGASVVLTFFVATRFVPKRVAMLPALVVLLVGGPWFKSFYALCTLVALAGCLVYTRRPSTASAATLGLGVAFALAFRQDIGLVAAGLAVLALCGTHLVEGPRPARTVFTHAGIVLATAAAALLPLLGPLALAGAVAPMLDQLFRVSPSLTAGKDPVDACLGFMRASTYQGLVYATPPLAGLVALGIARTETSRRVRLDILLLVVCALVVLLPAYTAPGLIRFYQAHHLAWILVVFVLWTISGKLLRSDHASALDAGRTASWRRFALALLVPALFAADALNDRGRRAAIPKWSGVVTSSIGRVHPTHIRGQRVYVTHPRDRWLPRLVRFTQRHTAPDDHVLFLPSGSLLNHACNRPNGTRYIDVWAFNYLDNPIARDIAESYVDHDLVEADPRLVFLRMTGRKLRQSALADTLEARNFVPVRTFGPFTAYARTEDLIPVSPERTPE